MKTKTFLGWAWRGALLSLTGLLVWGCSKYEETNTTVAPVASYPYALVACANSSAGKNSLAVIQLNPAATPRINFLMDLGSDPKLDPIVRTNDLSWQKRAFVIQRESGSATGKGKVALLDPANRFQVKTRFQVNDGSNPANPQDLLVLAADKAYITRYEDPYNDILIVDPDTGDTLGRVDFTGQGTNSDGLPRLYKMFPLQGRVWALMQNINLSFSEYGPGLIGVVNPNTDAIENIITLATKNPTDLGYDSEANLLYVASTGDWFDPATAGIEAVNPATQTSAGVLIDGNALGGFITRMVMIGQNNAYLVVLKSDGSEKVVQVNPATKTIGPTLYEYPCFWWAADLALDEPQGILLIADPSTSQVMLMDLATGLIVDSFDTPVPPLSLAIWEGED